MRGEQRQVRGAEPVLGGRGLMPIGIEERGCTDGVEAAALLGREANVGAAEVVGKLRLVARADDERGHGGAPEQPGKRHLRPRYAGSLGDRDDNLDDVVEPVFVADRWLVPGIEMARPIGDRLAAAVLAGEQPAGDRAPDQNAEALVDRDRHELVLSLARLKRVVDLLADETLVAPGV